jgi:hypothetical protein
VVAAFIRAMHEWELASWAAARACRDSDDPGSYLAGVAEACSRIFKAYCTPRDRPYGRQNSFSRPPDYDPERETVGAQSIKGRIATVDTTREAVIGGGEHRYVLHLVGGEWLIDNLKIEQDGKWDRVNL